MAKPQRQTFAHDTWLDPEEAAYPAGGFTRHGFARITANDHNPLALPYGSVRAVRASIPDTWFTIPAFVVHQGRRVKGFLTVSDQDGSDAPILLFFPEADPAHCLNCQPQEGCKRDQPD